MKATNNGEKIILEGSFFETAILKSAVESYVLRNPDALDIEIAEEWLDKLHNPVVQKN